MADFCTQCAYELDFEPDFFGLITKEDVDKGLEIIVLCEGCGPTGVDHEGWCNGGCKLKHEEHPRELFLKMKEAWKKKMDR